METYKEMVSKKPILGEDLDSLRELLGLSTSEACWLFGMSLTKWSLTARPNAAKSVANQPLSNPTLALLVRALRARPELSPVPPKVSAQDVYRRLKEVDPEMDLKRLSVFFGCEASSGYRWITMRSKISPALLRLFTVFVTIFDHAKHTGGIAAMEKLVGEWRSMVEFEAVQRGIPKIFATGRWIQDPEAPVLKPIKGEDLDSLREQIGLTSMDACWLFGLPIGKWTQIARGSRTNDQSGRVNKPKEPLSNITLALLVRVLRENAWACPIQRAPTADEVFEAIAVGYPGIDRKRMAILFGREASSGYRWLTTQSRLAPALTRLFEVFMRMKKDAGESRFENARLIESWEEMVLAEAASRGVTEILRIGRWVPAQVAPMVRPRAVRRASSQFKPVDKDQQIKKEARQKARQAKLEAAKGGAPSAPAKRGRPRKVQLVTPEQALAGAVVGADAAASATKKRGRPKQVKAGSA